MKTYIFILAVVLACIVTPADASRCGYVYIDGKPHWVCDYRN